VRAHAVALRTGRDRAEAAAAAEAEGIKPTDLHEFGKFAKRWAEDHPRPTATLDDVVAHLEHVRDVAGIDHIGLGGDYDGVETTPVGLEDVAGYPRLFAALMERTWSDDDLVKLAGGNLLRAFRRAEEVAAELQKTRKPSLVTFSS